MSASDGTVTSLGWSRNVALLVMMAAMLVLAGTLGAGFVWGAFYPLIADPESDATFLGVHVSGVPTTFAWGDFAVSLALGLMFLGTAGLIVVGAVRVHGSRVLADASGVAVRTGGRSHYPWARIDRFEVVTTIRPGLYMRNQPDVGLYDAVMVLTSGERIGLKALRTGAPFGGHNLDDLTAAVATLNALRPR